MLRAVATLAFFLPTIAAAAPAASTVDLHVRSLSFSHPEQGPSLAGGTQSGNYAQLIDHQGGLAGQTFQQRYWYDSEFASGPDAPVIYHMCGESNVDDAYFLNDYALDWAKQLGAHVVWLEHRYYGPSQPFSDLATDHLKYLSLANIMEDLATFQQWISQQQGWTGKWIAVGGSYSATMAALYRQKHPELVVGALAASAPMISGQGNSTDSDLSDMSSTDVSNEGRSWGYQACSELGYWQAEGASRGSPIDYPSTSLCSDAFQGVPYFNADAYNKAYDQPFLADVATAPSNILFTYGSDDVWTDIGLATQQNQNPAITILTIQGAGHHYDLNAASSGDSAAVQAARAKFTSLAQGWLGMTQD
jgi:pimeloyl-ACP methyl ester carboxylesterase